MNEQEELLEKIILGGSTVHRWDKFKCLSCRAIISLLQYNFKRKGRNWILLPKAPKSCAVCGNTRFKKVGYSYLAESGKILFEKKLKEKVKKKGEVE